MQWADLCCLESLDRYRLTLSCYEFDLYCLSVPIAVYDRADVTCLETVSRKCPAKHNHV